MYPIKDIDNSTFAFAGSVLSLMPAEDEIPAEFKNLSNKWNRIFNHLYFKNALSVKFSPKAGVDEIKALRQIRAIMRSYEPSHEHKEAAVAFLLSEWFTDVRIDCSPT